MYYVKIFKYQHQRNKINIYGLSISSLFIINFQRNFCQCIENFNANTGTSADTYTSINLRKSKCSIGSTNCSKNYTFHSKFLHIFSDFCLVSSTECPDMAAAVRLQETGNVCGGHP